MGIEDHKFKKGQSGNPNGRPKNDITPLKTVARRVMMEINPKTGNTAIEDTFRVLRKLALAGNIHAMKLIFETVWGKPTQQIDHTSGGEPFAISTAGLTDEEACAVVMNGGNG